MCGRLSLTLELKSYDRGFDSQGVPDHGYRRAKQ